MTPQSVIEAARGWIDTPFRHQARVKGLGIDCAGLIVESFREAGFDLVDKKDYARLPSGHQLRAELQRRLVKVRNLRPADVLELAWHGYEASHLALYTERGTMIHANGSEWSKLSKVIEHGYRDPWPARTVAIWRLPAFQAVT